MLEARRHICGSCLISGANGRKAQLVRQQVALVQGRSGSRNVQWSVHVHEVGFRKEAAAATEAAPGR